MRLAWSLSLALWITTALPIGLRAQQSQENQEAQKPPASNGDHPQRQASQKERKKNDKALRKELGSQYRKLLDEDLAYIITPEEREAFLHLSTDEEREQFIEQFWLRRDPTPDTVENEYKEEHYRRIAYANERFTVGTPGWRSDRGRIYILYGAPDHIDVHPTGGMYHQNPEEGRSSFMTYPFEVWHYRVLEGIGNNISLEFVDSNGIGDYRLTSDPYEKQIFATPGALTRTFEPLWGGNNDQAFRQMERMELYAKVQRAPGVKFKDLETLVTSRLVSSRLPFEIRTDFVRITGETLLVPITVAIEKKSLNFELKNEVHQAVVNVFGRVTTPGGRIVQTFEDVIELNIPAALFASSLNEPAVYQKALPLRSGLYKLNLVLRDVNSGNVGLQERRLAVPQFEEDKLTHSTLILADLIEDVPNKELGLGQFVIGAEKVRPVVNRQFKQNQQLGIYMQVYNLGVNASTHKPDASIQYALFRDGQSVFSRGETAAQLDDAGEQMTLARLLPLTSFPPGKYVIVVSVSDHTLGQAFQASANFQIVP